MNKNGKKILVVFNTIEQKEHVHKALKMNEFFKFLHYMSKMFQLKSDPIGYYS
jgi:CRISPR/Cas system-associated endonuclease/helicase Cas3